MNKIEKLSYLCQFCELKDVDGFVEVGCARVDADDHPDGALTFEVVPEEMSDLCVSVGHAAGFSGLLVLAKLLDAGAQRHQRVVNVAGLAKPISGITRPTKIFILRQLKFEN